MNKLKKILFDLFDKYEDYYDIIDTLRNLESENYISSDDYDKIMENYEKWLNEYENKKER